MSLARFDRAYLEMYPYLEGYLPWRSGERVLEIGLGYGTVGQLLADRGLDYHGLDISPGPVGMMIHRLELLGVSDASARVTQGSALAIPHPDASFDVVVTIGCLHHTGDLARAVGEVRRVLAPGRPGDGHGLQPALRSAAPDRMLPLLEMLRVPERCSPTWRDPARRAEIVRGIYDADSEGNAAPATEFTSVADVRRMFAGFSRVRVRRENFDDLVLHVHGVTLSVSRAVLLNNVARIAGLDLYVTATL